MSMRANSKMNCPACRSAIDEEVLLSDERTCPHCGEDLKDTAVGGLNSPTESTKLMSLPTIRGISIIRQIGEGGMGCVWEAEQKSLGRRVAVKALSPNLATNPHFMSRFRQEAKALAKLSHPSIVSVYDLIEEGSDCCIIMEYIEGPGGGEPIDVKSLMHNQSLQVTQVKQIIIQVLKALQTAHERGIIHRDVKPSNIMVDAGFHAKVVDFGIAALQGTADDRRLTVAGGTMGTLDYMAPEQLNDAKSVDARADIYSAGVVLYEMLTGKLPRGAFSPPSVVVNGLAAGWDTVVMKALAPERKDRFGNAAEMAAAIETIPVDNSEKTVVPAAPRKPKSSVSVPDRACSQCHTAVAADDVYCPSCGKALLRNCPSCRKSLDAGAKFCKACGVDVHKWEKHQEHFAAGIAAVQQAKITTTRVEERFEYAEQAALHLTKAIKLRPEDVATQEALATAVELATKCGNQAAQTAIDRKEIPRGIDLLEAVLEINPGDKQAQSQHAKMMQQRDKLAEKAEELLQQGQVQKAAAGLEKALELFPKDQKLARLLDQSQASKGALHDLSRQVKTLEAEKKLYELNDVLQAARKQPGGLPLALSDYASKLSEQLGDVQKTLKNAQTQFNQGDYESARVSVDRVREFVVDNPNANQLWSDIAREERRSRRTRILWRIVFTLVIAGTATGAGFYLVDYLNRNSETADNDSDDNDPSETGPASDGGSQSASTSGEPDSPSGEPESDTPIAQNDPPPGDSLGMPDQLEPPPADVNTTTIDSAVDAGQVGTENVPYSDTLNGWYSKNDRFF
jgi:serine/threonine protein kinase